MCLHRLHHDDRVRRLVFDSTMAMSFVPGFKKHNKLHKQIEHNCQTIASEIACNYVDWMVGRLVKRYKQVVKQGQLVCRVVYLERYHHRLSVQVAKRRRTDV